MSIRVGGIPLILSMLHWRFRRQNSPALWRQHMIHWRNNFIITLVKQWLSFSLLKILEVFVLMTLASAWIIFLIKEIG